MTIHDPVLADQVDPGALHRLMAWLSPSFPVGAFSYSHGLEWAIEDGTVTSAATLEAWIGDILLHGAGRSDAILFAHAAAALGDAAALRDIVDLAAVLVPGAERRLESLAQGRAFLIAVRAAWPNAALEQAAAVIEGSDGQGPAYAVAVAIAAAAHGVPRRPAAHAYLHAFAANIVSAGLRAVPLGQTDGQKIIARLGPTVGRVIDATEGLPLDALGGAAFRADIASMKHETQYTRLFRS